MPKKGGINKTYSFSEQTVKKLEEICREEMRTQTNVLEVAIHERWLAIREKHKE